MIEMSLNTKRPARMVASVLPIIESVTVFFGPMISAKIPPGNWNIV